MHVAASRRLTVEGPGPAEVVVVLRNGDRRSASVNPNVPDPESELDARYDALASKFDELTTPVIGVEQAARLMRLISGL